MRHYTLRVQAGGSSDSHTQTFCYQPVRENHMQYSRALFSKPCRRPQSRDLDPQAQPATAIAQRGGVPAVCGLVDSRVGGVSVVLGTFSQTKQISGSLGVSRGV